MHLEVLRTGESHMDPADPTHSRDPLEEIGTTGVRHVPEKWVGKEIHLVAVRADASMNRCTLEEVNDRGVVVSHDGKTSFHPWNSVVALQLREREPRDQEVHSF